MVDIKNFFLFFLFIFLLLEKVEAQSIKLSCNVKTHVQYWEDEVWSNIKNQNWDLEIDYKRNLLIRRRDVFFKGKYYPLRWNYTIFTKDRDKIVAYDYEDMSSEKGGLSASSITLDLISKKLTTSNHMTDDRGYAFTLHYGKCFQE